MIDAHFLGTSRRAILNGPERTREGYRKLDLNREEFAEGPLRRSKFRMKDMRRNVAGEIEKVMLEQMRDTR